MQCGLLRDQLKYIETESCPVGPCFEPSSGEEDAASGEMEPEPLQAGQSIKQWTDYMESNLRIRLKKSESEVEILQKHRGDIRDMIYKLQMIVGWQMDDSESRAYGSETRKRLEQLVEKLVEISSNVNEELSNLERECSTALNRSETNTSVEEEIGNNVYDLKSIERAVHTWSETMFLMTRHYGNPTEQFHKYQNAAVDLMMILNGHFQTIARFPEEYDNRCRTFHIFGIMQDKLANVRLEDHFGTLYHLMLQTKGAPEALHVLETDRKMFENRLNNCIHAFGEGSTYYTHVAYEIAQRKENIKDYIDVLTGH
ncbi:hypothetical protein DPMN_151375 [Dreissena polymorpha]|uniref:Uncharacterized protein n=1 Tax=Dreissena polymorpha TaxID=45954 RepID=A0A9D4FIB2_DREPO|nr:hypothetical protein DPMN_151375 [Dreissena polymorpha]